VAWTYSLLAYVALHRDELGTAEEVLCTAQQSTSGPGPPMAGDMILWCRALLREALGEATGVASLVEEAWELEVAFKVVTRARMGPDAVRLARAAGADHVAVRVTADVEGVAERTGSPLYRGLALRCRGLLEADIDTLLAAVAALRRCRRPVELAFAAEDAGVALGRAGRVPEAVSLLGEAVAQYEQIDAGRDVARTDAALRALGVRRGRPGARPRDKVGWDSVTRAEEDVVALVGQGLTNAQIGARLFVSPRTVETHLSHLYRKLGISSRTALAAEAARRAG
jgi:DNA-binding CsgD family transcriptional regulator